jgi:uracil-DNA glycosylase family 4
MRVQRPARERLGAAVLFRGIGSLGRTQSLVVTEGDPQHQCDDGELDQRHQQHDPNRQLHPKRCYYWRVKVQASTELEVLAEEVAGCRRCPRLVAWREEVARERRAAFAEQRYWGRPLPGFGDPSARLLVLGLAPAAHGANRTGRMFTGDRSGDFLFAALWRAGFASQPTSVERSDGLRLLDAWITAAVRCAPPANRPTPQERDACLPWSMRELRLLADVRVVLCLGAFAWDAALRLTAAVADTGRAHSRPRPRFAHAAELETGAYTLLGCYHPSQQNTFTGRLTEPMIDEVLERASELAGRSR